MFQSANQQRHPYPAHLREFKGSRLPSDARVLEGPPVAGRISRRASTMALCGVL
jgi:hypothetical protein